MKLVEPFRTPYVFSVPLLVNGFQIVELLFSETMYFMIVREHFSCIAEQGFPTDIC